MNTVDQRSALESRPIAPPTEEVGIIETRR